MRDQKVTVCFKILFNINLHSPSQDTQFNLSKRHIKHWMQLQFMCWGHLCLRCLYSFMLVIWSGLL